MHGGGLHVAIVQSPPDVGGLLKRVVLDAVTIAGELDAFESDFGELVERARVGDVGESVGGIADLDHA